MNLRPIVALAVIGWLSAGPASAGVRDDVIAGAVRCAQIPDDRRWLDCFYGSAQPMRSQLGLPPAPQAQIRLSTGIEPAAPIAPAIRKNDGLFSNIFGESNDQAAPKNSRASAPASQAVSDVRMVAFSFDRTGIFTATLSNGQVWRQLSGDTTQAHWSKPPGAALYKVEIKHGALGSLNMRVAGTPGSFKVERIQ